jgi:orotate phosphoribosyltransferase-like protein
LFPTLPFHITVLIVFIIGLLKPSLINKQIEENAIQNDETAKYTMKRQFDERNHTKPCDIQIGNSVLKKTILVSNSSFPHNCFNCLHHWFVE